MSAQHTPGPWKTNTAGSAGPWPAPFKITEIYVYAPDTQDDVAVCSEIIDPVTQEPSEANARLIASAPDLLEALRRLSLAAMSRENVMGDPCTLMVAKAELAAANKHACAVIAKATGSAA